MLDELSIVIPTLNEAICLPQLLASIADQRFDGKLQVIVVDGQSTDGTPALAERFRDDLPDLLVLSTTRNPGHQRNFGARCASHQYLLFLDADVILPPGFLNSLAKKVDAHGPFVASVLHLAPRMTPLDYAAVVLLYAFLLIARLAGTPVTTGDFILTTRAQHERINGFVEGALVGEDTDYGIRSVTAGASYHLYLTLYIYASPRRMRQVGRFRLILFWSKSFLHVRRHGPIFPGQGIAYPFGNYREPG